MFNEAQLNVVGYVASEPQFSRVGNGIPKLTMRVAWTTRRKEPATGEWVDGNTSFVRVTCWRRLAENLATCLRKGEPVLLRGRLDVRPFTGKDGVRRVSVDVDASYLGYDLSRGVASFKRVWENTGKTAEEAAAAAGNGAAGGFGGGPEDGFGGAAGRFGGGPEGGFGGAAGGFAGGPEGGFGGGTEDGPWDDAGGDGFADGEAAVPALAGGPGPVPADGSADGSGSQLGGGPADEEIFDDSAIDALAEDSASVATPS
jgi:single-strand DNA-binding protein